MNSDNELSEDDQMIIAQIEEIMKEKNRINDFSGYKMLKKRIELDYKEIMSYIMSNYIREINNSRAADTYAGKI